jgi:hypothetical protein
MVQSPDNQKDTEDDLQLGMNPDAFAPACTDSGSESESENPELGLEDRDLEGWEDVETDSGCDSEADNGLGEGYQSEEDFVGMM